MPRCAAIKPSGERCKISVEPPAELCWAHDPRNREQRRRITSKAGKARPCRELAEIKTLLASLTARVLKEEDTEPLETGPAAVANQLTNTRLRAIEVERKMKETDELEGRIEALERAQEGGRRWGA